MNDEALRRIAHRRASFKRDLFLYLIVMALLLMLNLWKNPEHMWVMWPAIGWGVGLAYHAWIAYGSKTGNLEEEEYRKLKSKYEKRGG
jgi:hypothetical protein